MWNKRSEPLRSAPGASGESQGKSFGHCGVLERSWLCSSLPSQVSEMLFWWLRIGHGGSIYTMEIGKCCISQSCICRALIASTHSLVVREIPRLGPNHLISFYPGSLLSLISSKGSFLPEIVHQTLEDVPSLTSLKTTVPMRVINQADFLSSSNLLLSTMPCKLTRRINSSFHWYSSCGAINSKEVAACTHSRGKPLVLLTV